MVKIGEYVREIMADMEKKGFTKGEVICFIKMLEEEIERNNERIEKQKPFIVYKWD